MQPCPPDVISFPSWDHGDSQTPQRCRGICAFSHPAALAAPLPWRAGAALVVWQGNVSNGLNHEVEAFVRSARSGSAHFTVTHSGFAGEAGSAMPAARRGSLGSSLLGATERWRRRGEK